MKCASCGLPLSPTRTHCPRCGTARNGEPGKYNEQSFDQAEVPQLAFPSQQGGNGFPGAQINAEALQPQWRPLSPAAAWGNQNAQATPFIQQPFPVYQPAGSEMPLPTQFPNQAGQLRLPDVGGDLQAEPTAGLKPASQSRPGNMVLPQLNSGAFPQFPQPPRKSAHATGGRPQRLNLTIAGLCVLTGGLILTFVYIISLSLPPSTTGNPPGQVAIATATTGGLSPAAQGSTTTSQPTPTVTPTMSLPGQPYIDTAQTASRVNTYTAQPIQLANNFKVKQQIFVTFMLHPKIGGGAVCLLWYLNQKEFSQYAFAVDATPQLAYSYAYAGNPGPGSVEIYWASTTACPDKALAQVVNFTVNP